MQAHGCESFQRKENMNEAINPDFDHEDQYKIIVQTAQEGICTLDDEHKINFVNEKFIELLGFSREECIGLDFSKLLLADEQEKVMDQITGCKQTTKTSLDVRYVTKSGSIIWTTTTTSPLLDRLGHCKGILAMVMDITERKAVVDAIKDSEAQFRSFFENSLDGFLLTVPNEKIFAANPAACALFQMTEEEICRMPVQDLFNFAEPKLVEVLKTRNRRGRAKADVMFYQKDGTEIPGEVTTVLFKDAKGKKQASIIIRDVSDRSQRAIAEQTLQRSEANLRTIYNNTDVGYVLVDADLNVVSYNALAVDVSLLQGYKDPEEGESILGYFDPERHDIIRGVIARVLNGEKIEYEISRLEPDGSEKWYNLRWIPIAGEKHQNMGLLLSIGDITKVKVAAIERERITAELLQRNKDLEQFTYVVSHNLRAPVANIMGLSSLIEDFVEHAEGAEELVKRLSASVKKLDNVITDLNHVLQVREQVQERKEKIDISQLMDDLQLSIKHLMTKHQVSLQTDFSSTPVLFTIRAFLYSVFYNLVTNSIRYRRSGVPPVISVTGEALPDAIRITFEDNGKGIDLEKDGHNIFGLYKRIDTTVEGKGMGLFLVKTQVEALKGAIEVESELDKGTRFTLTFPI